MVIWQLIWVLQYLQTIQLHSCAYVLKNVPPLGDSRLAILVTWQQIRAWIEELMYVDAIAIDSCAHYFQWVWIILVLLYVLHNAYCFIQGHPHAWWMTLWI
jgi:hypothetical protein